MGEADNFVEDLRTYADQNHYGVQVSYCQIDGAPGVTVRSSRTHHVKEKDILAAGEYRLVLERVAAAQKIEFDHVNFSPGQRQFYSVVNNIVDGKKAIEAIVAAEGLVEKITNALIEERQGHIKDLADKLSK